MKRFSWQKAISRRGFLKRTLAGIFFSIFSPFSRFSKSEADSINPLFWIKGIHNQPFYGGGGGKDHAGVDSLIQLMGDNGLKFYRSAQETALSGPSGMIEANDVVLIKVNAQWKYRGCTNSDLIRGLIQRILDHPDGFSGEVVIFENGQGSGNLNCDRGESGYPDTNVHANANDENQSFLYLVNTVFNDHKVSAFLLDPIRDTFIGATDHSTNGYRTYENVSYPCFTTAGGRRVELREGIWNGNSYSQNLKLINVPVLKYHDTGGSEITASLKLCYGIVSMSDGQKLFRHYGGLGETCGKIMVSVRTPVLNIVDATWVSYASLEGYPASTTFRANQILVSQDPVALDYWAAKYIMYPISQSPRHLPTFSGIDQWLTSARDTINSGGGLYDPNTGIQVGLVTKNEAEMSALIHSFLQPTTTTLAASEVTHTSATLNGTVNPHESATTYYFEWGTSPSYGNPTSSQAAGSGSIDVAVSADLSGLIPNTVYHYRLVATNSEGPSYGQDLTFYTGPPGAATLIAPWGTMSLISPTYYWNAVSYATHYRLIVNDSTGNKVDQWYTAEEAGCAWGTGICSVTPTTFLALGNGSWMIQTKNDIGDGPWSSVLNFNIVANAPKVDFNGDGKADLLWRNKSTGEVDVWYMNGEAISGGEVIVAAGAVPLSWEMVGTGDFNNDGKTDLLWRNKTTGGLDVWFMNGAAINGGAVVVSVGVVPPIWEQHSR